MKINHKKIKCRYLCQYVAITMFLVLLLLTWYGVNRYSNFKIQQHMLIKQSISSATVELTTLLGQLKETASTYTRRHLSLIQYLAKNPEDIEKIKILKKSAVAYFPNYFALTIADSKGVPLLGNYDLQVNEMCQRSIKEFIAGGYNYDIFIHPHVGAYHFDIMTSWQYKGSKNVKGIFFISIKPAAIVRVLKTAEILGHKLYLTKNNVSGLIEISSAGSRIDIKRQGGDFFLNKAEINNIGLSVAVPGTRWNLVDVANSRLMSNRRNSIILQTSLIFLGIVILNIVFFMLIRREEELHSQTEEKHKQTKEKLESALKFSNVVTWEYDLLTKKFTWSSHAASLFGDTLPDKYDDYLNIVGDEFREDFKLFIRRCLNYGGSQHLEHKIKHSQFGDIWLEIKGSNIHIDKLCSFKLLGLVQNITDRKIAEQNHIIFELKQKDVLLREVHHRIKNNLQGIMSLLQQHKHKPCIDKNVIDHAISQLYSVSLIHGINGRNMHGEVELTELVNKISDSAFSMSGNKYKPYSALTKKYVINSRENNTVAIALIINELVFNAIKHTPRSRINDIRITIISTIDAAVIEIVNPGKELAEIFDFEEGTGLGTGLTLARSLLPKKGAKIIFKQTQSCIVCHFILSSPILENSYEITTKKRIDTV